MLSKGDNAPVAVSLASVSSAPFRSNYALFDTLFRSNLTGQIDGRDISISTQRTGGGRITQWRMPDLQAATVSRFVTRPPVGWLRDGTLNVSVDDRWRLGTGTDIDMDWNVRMQGVRAEAREGAGLVEKTFALPITSYINSKSGNVDLRFKLVINEDKFENMSSLDAGFLWDVVLQSTAEAIGIGAGEDPEKDQARGRQGDQGVQRLYRQAKKTIRHQLAKVGAARFRDYRRPPTSSMMSQQVGGILIDAIGAGAFQLLLAIAAGEQANAERAGAARGQHVPDAVADDRGRFDRRRRAARRRPGTDRDRAWRTSPDRA